MEALLTRVLASQPVATTGSSTQPKPVQLVEFNPDNADVDIEGWCKVTELIVKNKQLEGVDLLVALTGALKGRAASYLTQINLEELKWDAVKESLIARFCRPKVFQDYFDEVLRFQIGAKETAPEAGLRLWNMIERIPKTQMAEEAITGFAISVLCQKDGFVRRELNAHTITTKAHLFRILGGISLKRRQDVSDTQETDNKRPRLSDTRFPGKCHWCGIPGHRQVECRKRREDSTVTSRHQDASISVRPPEKTVICYTCGKSGHVTSNCPEKKTGGGAATPKEVNLCEQRLSRGTLRTSSVPESCISDPVIIGRDILENGVSVQINNDELVFSFKEQTNFCNSIAAKPDFSQIDTDLTDVKVR
ncbi:uncharacterized protein [Choristoneura fumiferana]|uniref:uncharacterized protein n=1 Tax=Choristoneura fumiferana TaxID=7141 RepID=UPI003D155C35